MPKLSEMAITANEVRKTTRRLYPTVKFWIRGGQGDKSVYVSWQDGPSIKTLKGALSAYPVDIARSFSKEFQAELFAPFLASLGLTPRDVLIHAWNRLHFFDKTHKQHEAAVLAFLYDTEAPTRDRIHSTNPYERDPKTGAVRFSKAETGKFIKEDLKARWPSVKFSVTSAEHRAVTVSWQDGPSEEQVQAVLENYRQGYNNTRDGMTDYAGHVEAMTHERVINGQSVLVQYDCDHLNGIAHADRNYSFSFLEPLMHAVKEEYRLAVDITPDLVGKMYLVPLFENGNLYHHNMYRAVMEKAKPIGMPPAEATPCRTGEVATSTTSGEITVNYSQKDPTKPGWWWFSGNTKPHKETLKAAGARWSSKREAWYYIGDQLPEALAALQAGDPAPKPAVPQSVPQPATQSVPQAAPQPAAPKSPAPTPKPAAPAPAAPKSPAAAFRKHAATLQKRIDFCFKERLENTDKRRREADGLRQEGRDLQRVALFLTTLAAAWEDGTLPDSLRPFNSVGHVYEMAKFERYRERYEERDFSLNERRHREKYQHYHEVMLNAAPDYDAALAAVATLRGLMSDPAAGKTDPKAVKLAELRGKVLSAKPDGFFPTPDSLAQKMVSRVTWRDGMTVLEPSAGMGHLADAFRARYPSAEIKVIEFNWTLGEILCLKGYDLIENNFMEYEGKADIIIMNPPFERGADMDHVRKAYECLSEGGQLVAIMSAGVFFRQDKKATAFREWLDSVGTFEQNDPDAFRKAEVPTGVQTYLVEIRREG